MEIFTENPRSFKMDRKSPQASKLKSSVSEKLFEFLGNYSDDVLAEYIVVLVCNGKHQYQARVDLEAFLGDESGNFVAWLWSHLSETVNISKTPSGMTNPKVATVTNGCVDDLDREQKFSMTGISNNPLSEDEKQHMLSAFSPKLISTNIDNVSEECQRWCPGFDASVTDINTEEVHASFLRSEIPQKRTGNHKGAMKHGSSRERCSNGISAGGEQCLRYEDQYKKIVNGNHNGSPHLLLHSPKRESVSRNMESGVTENPHSKLISMTNAAATGLSSRAADAASHHDVKRRGNVWDRLGKPRENDGAMMCDRNYPDDIDIIKRKKLEHGREGLEKHRLMLVVPDVGLNKKLVREIAVLDNSSGKLISNTKTSECTRLEHSVNTMHGLNDAGISRWKLQLGGMDSSDGLVPLSDSRDGQLQAKVPFQGLQRLQSVKRGLSQHSSGVTSDTRSSDGLFSGAPYHSLKYPNAALNLEPYKKTKTHAQLNREAPLATTQPPVSVCSSLLAKSESLSHAGTQLTSHQPVQAEVLDMKLKLQQIEMEMNKLRSKQAEMNNDGKSNAPLGAFRCNKRSSVITFFQMRGNCQNYVADRHSNSPTKRVETRLPFIYYFICRSAFVVFASKASADKAVVMSGTSFFSRTLKVVRKADVPVGISMPAQPTGKPSQLWRPTPPLRKGPLQRPYSSSHLQWRRDPQTNAENRPSTQASMPDFFKNAEQGGGETGCNPATCGSQVDARTKTGSSTENPSA
ncbi:uncharacterized protein LOC131217651 isoform X2 [Magnolia sinica]|uniref:uncharacterized protein LOC131217651 isoform X2 n=1 Tax=Magnolia sinica TaxID=86752 RepID=UPI00265B1FB8|nr:uncharacterized protein LOC131217651 isoform X2 [Magnolia sinica]